MNLDEKIDATENAVNVPEHYCQTCVAQDHPVILEW